MKSLRSWYERTFKCPHTVLIPLTIRRYLGSAPAAILNCEKCGKAIHVKLRGMGEGTSDNSLMRCKDIQMSILGYEKSDDTGRYERQAA